MVLASGQQRASGWGKGERLGPHLQLGTEGWLGVFLTASPHPHEAPADAASEPAALARCSWFTPRCVSPARGCPGLPISTMGRGWALGPPREGAHFCELWNLVLLLQGPLSLASTEAKSCPSCDLSFPTTGTCRGLLGGRRGAGSPLAVSSGGGGRGRPAAATGQARRSALNAGAGPPDESRGVPGSSLCGGGN